MSIKDAFEVLEELRKHKWWTAVVAGGVAMVTAAAIGISTEMGKKAIDSLMPSPSQRHAQAAVPSTHESPANSVVHHSSTDSGQQPVTAHEPTTSPAKDAVPIVVANPVPDTVVQLPSWKPSRAFVPPHIRGDKEFGLSPGGVFESRNLGYFETRADLKISADGTKLFAVFYMHGHEFVHDHTTVEGTSDTNGTASEFVIYTAPPGTVIKQIITPAVVQDSLRFVQNDEKRVDNPQHGRNATFVFSGGRPVEGGNLIENDGFNISRNGFVRNWYVVADTQEHEAGSLTSVSIETEPITIKIGAPVPQVANSAGSSTMASK